MLNSFQHPGLTTGLLCFGRLSDPKHDHQPVMTGARATPLHSRIQGGGSRRSAWRCAGLTIGPALHRMQSRREDEDGESRGRDLVLCFGRLSDPKHNRQPVMTGARATPLHSRIQSGGSRRSPRRCVTQTIRHTRQRRSARAIPSATPLHRVGSCPRR